MLSRKTIDRIAKLKELQADYQPNSATKKLLADKTLVMLVGATCMGKSTVMSQLSADIPTVGTITTRPMRPDDNTARYTFFDHTDTGLSPLLDAIEAGELVQYVINPHSGFIYGSRIEDYPGDINIGDYFSSVVSDFKTYGFGKIMPISVITDPQSWRARFEKRFPVGHPDRQARLKEAAESLKWSLSQPDTAWVINSENQSQMAATSVKNIIRGEITDQTEVRKLAEGCLALIRSLL